MEIGQKISYDSLADSKKHIAMVAIPLDRMATRIAEVISSGQFDGESYSDLLKEGRLPTSTITDLLIHCIVKAEQGKFKLDNKVLLTSTMGSLMQNTLNWLKAQPLNSLDYVDIVVDELHLRMREHDKSKLTSPEKEAYDTMVPELRAAEYGSEEYLAIIEKYKPMMQSHYTTNKTHHIEGWENGIADMNLLHMAEMCADWSAAAMRSKSDIEDMLGVTSKRYNLCGVLKPILKTTLQKFPCD